MKKKIAVIGSGIGGSAAAALLAKKGYGVSLFESHSFAGGRCSTQSHDGFEFDFGVHMFSRGARGPLGEVSRRLGRPVDWITCDPACRVLGKVSFDLPLNVKGLFKRFSLFSKLGFKPKDFFGIFRLFYSLINGRISEKVDRQTLQAFVSKYTQNSTIHQFMNGMSQLYFSLSYQDASAGEFIWCFSRMFRNAAYGYPKGGAAAIPRAYLKELEGFSGVLHFEEPVKKILVEEGQVKGIETAVKSYPADLVISNSGIGNTLNLAGKENFPDDYVKKSEELRYCNAYVTIKYALSQAVIPYPAVLYLPDLPAANMFDYIPARSVPVDPLIFMPVVSNMDPGLAPEGKQFAIAGTAVPADSSSDLCLAVLDKVHSTVCDLFPGLEKAVIRQWRIGAEEIKAVTGRFQGETIGIAQTPDQVGRLRPDIKTPIKGLWLVGADAGARGIGCEMAAASALSLADRL